VYSGFELQKGVVGAVQIQLSVAMRMYRNTEACHSTRHFQHSTEVDVQAGLGLEDAREAWRLPRRMEATLGFDADES
jgi:hypothetical protein